MRRARQVKRLVPMSISCGCGTLHWVVAYRFIQHLPGEKQAMEIVWSAARLQAESLSWVVWSAQMYPACLWR